MDYKLHNESTKRSVNPYADNYTGFIWNGHHSSDFNCFIENTGHLTFEPAPDFSNSTVSPAFYDGALYTGTQIQSKKIQLNLVFYHVTLKNFNEALKWLDRKIVSSFLLDYEPEWRYQCKLSSIGVTEKYVDGYCIDQNHGNYKKQDLYICRMQVGFETVDIHNALSTYAQIQYSIEGISNIFHNYGLRLFLDENEFEYIEDNDPYDYDQVIEYKPYKYIKTIYTYYDNPPESKYIYKGTYTINDELYTIWHDEVESSDTTFLLLPARAMVTHTFNIINPSSLPMHFRIHLFDFTVKDIIVYQVTESGKIPICMANLNLDDQQPISLHYDSKTGAITLANRLIQSLHISDGSLLCSYCATLSNISVPFGDSIQLEIPDYDGQVFVEYDYQTDVI